MRVQVNGEAVEIADGATVRELVETLKLRGPVAVEVNKSIVRRADHETTTLREGDRLEIVTLVGGG